jgi:hypothetical protein
MKVQLSYPGPHDIKIEPRPWEKSLWAIGEVRQCHGKFVESRCEIVWQSIL